MNRYKNDIEQFAQDLYDLMGLNGMKARAFFNKYVVSDDAFMVDTSDEDEAIIYFDDLTITIKRK